MGQAHASAPCPPATNHPFLLLAQVLAGARLPESEEEWAALRAALAGVRQHLRRCGGEPRKSCAATPGRLAAAGHAPLQLWPAITNVLSPRLVPCACSDTSVEALHRELRDFVAMVVAWWEQRKKPDGAPGWGAAAAAADGGQAGSCGATPLLLPRAPEPRLPHPCAAPPSCPAGQGGAGLLKRVASAGVLLGGGGMVPLGPLGKKPCLEYLHLGGHSGLQPPQHPQVVPQATHYGGTIYAAPEIIAHPLLGGGGGSGRLPDRAAGEALGAPGAQGVVIEELNPSAHGGGGYLQALVTTTSEAQLFGQLFPPGGGEAPGSGGGGGAVHSPQAQREGSAENKEVGCGECLLVAGVCCEPLAAWAAGGAC